MMNNPKYITVAVVAVLFLFTGIAFGQWLMVRLSLLLNEAEMIWQRVRYRRNESHRIPSCSSGTMPPLHALGARQLSPVAHGAKCLAGR